MSPRVYDWQAGVAIVALTVTVIGAALASWWGLVASLWTFSTREFGSLAVVLAVRRSSWLHPFSASGRSPGPNIRWLSS